ncbi:hypothetical protein [Opitutus terrae]|uniref:Porin n=1 Tax=Opitutus terrae (strain DSM 11246 / JCM 15787 / PB90-1) TaxID=452637 RepID=B1ZTF7_OPITP|nr:hypothetical protein [Opitutus terrae]ACB73902.1 hypothetical protein Oter_0612 [Opitutus terrae PB90-1]
MKLRFVSSRSTRGVLSALAFALGFAGTSSAAVTWQDIQFGGFASQGYLLSSANDYLGETSDGTFDFREYALNASWAKGKFRIGAQAFGQKLGQYGEDRIKLDWATIDYQPAQWLGFRAGRVKMPRGLYNEALDLDSVRPFVLLPQSVYDARLRDFNAAFNGAMIFGNISLRQAGSVDYRLFYGDIPMSTSSGASDYFNNDQPFPNTSIGMDAVYGGSVFWNTPATGLRVGYSYSTFENFGVDRIAYYGGMTIPLQKLTSNHHRHLLSAEYTYGDWIFAAEAGWENAHSVILMAGQPSGSVADFDSDYYYVSVARRVHARVELGAYVSHSHDATVLIPAQAGLSLPPLSQTDYAVSAKFDLNEHLIFKLEGHYLDGSGKLFDTPAHPQPFVQRDNSWTMVAAKMTLSF